MRNKMGLNRCPTASMTFRVCLGVGFGWKEQGFVIASVHHKDLREKGLSYLDALIKDSTQARESVAKRRRKGA